jgi:transposase
MTVPMSVQEDIRRLDAQGVPGREIARRLGVSRDSVAKYAGLQDCSPRPVVAHVRPGGSVLTGFAGIIDGWLTDDARRPRKQRHTAKRVFDRLAAEEGYTGSYSPVQRYVKRWQAAHRTTGEGFAELVWPAGTAQVDFGQAEAVIAGVRQVLHVLVVTFPFSNMRFVQAYRGETAECVCHGLRTIFEHVGGAARHLVFDNATGAGRRTGKVVVESKLFAAFKLHYRAQARYCNPYSGHEKGNVENAVGFLRFEPDGPRTGDGFLGGVEPGAAGALRRAGRRRALAQADSHR